jgi:hypothetical protein
MVSCQNNRLRIDGNCRRPARIIDATQKCRTLTEAKNWVRKTESAVLEGQYVPDNKALKRTLSDLIERYIQVHLCKFPSRLKDQTAHLNWWKESYGP